MKARDFLIEKGLAKPGRGKFSNEAKVVLKEALANGEKFSDWPKDDIIVSTDTGEKTVKAVDPTDIEYTFQSDYPFPENRYRAFMRKDGKKVEVGMREVCNTCGVSLVAHYCQSPTILGTIPVTIEAR